MEAIIIKAVIYARYSSSAQRDTSIDQQLAACRSFAERQSIDIVDVYADRAMTGTNANRPAFQQMIADAAQRGWQYVIVYALDRFARNRYDSAVYKRQLRECGVRVLSATEAITDEPAGVLMEGLMEAYAEYYSIELSRKSQRGMLDNARKCMVNGQLPPGYRRGADGRYAVEEEEAAIIREVFRRVAAGDPIQVVVNDLDRRGERRRNGALYTRNVISKALTNERYTGVYIYKDVRIEGGVPQIIDKQLFQAVQCMLSTKQNPRKTAGVPIRREREYGMYLLTGKLFCGDCKSAMIGMSGRSKTGATHYYYVCHGNRQHKGCQRKAVRRDQIEYEICEAIQQQVLTEKNILSITDQIMAIYAEAPEVEELSRLEEMLQQSQEASRNLLKAIEAGMFSPILQQRMSELDAEQQSLQQRIAALKIRQASNLTREEVFLALDAFAHGDLSDPDYLAALIDAFLVRCYVYDDRFHFIFTIGNNKTTELDWPSFDRSLSESSSDVILGSPRIAGRTPTIIIVAVARKRTYA